MKNQKNKKQPEISAQALRQYHENRCIANKAVQKAIEENRKIGIKPSRQFSKV